MGEHPTQEILNPSTPSEVVNRLLRAGREQLDGILAIRPSEVEGPCVRLRLEAGLLTDLETEGEATLLGRALLASPSLRDRDRKRLRKEEAAGHGDAGAKAIEEGFLEEDEIARCIIEGLESEFARALVLPDAVVEIEADGPLRGGLLGCIELSLPIDEAILRAAQSGDRFDLARELPFLREIYYATPNAFEIFQLAEERADDVALLERFDGILDLAEVIEVGEFEPWLTIARVESFADQGFLAATNPVQLFQMGCEEERRENLPKALRLFLHAEELGLDDFDLGYRLAEVLQKVGRKDEALDHFHAFAEKCVGQFRIEDTIQAYAHILELDPDNLHIQEKYLTLLARYGRSDEALSSGVGLAKRLQEAGDEERARTLLEQLAEQADANEEVLRLYRDLCLATADPEGATRAAQRLGDLHIERSEYESALEVFQELFLQERENAQVRSRLAELHFRLGNTDKAAEHLDALDELSGWSPTHPSEDASHFYRKLLELGVEDSRVTAWLSQAAQGQESREDSAHYLQRHRDLLREAGDLEGARLAAAELQRLRPDDVDAARALAELERRCGRTAQAGVVLAELVTRLAESEAGPPSADWRALLEELIEVDPLSRIGRQHLLRAIDTAEEPEMRDRLALESAFLSLAAGRVDEARDHLGTLVPPPPLGPVLELCAGILARGGREGGESPADHFRRGANQAVDGGDRSLLSDLADRLEAIAPDDDDLQKLRSAAERLRTPDGPAMGRAPQAMKSSVTGITEKLRGLKTGPKMESGGDTRGGGGVNAALAKLKGLQGGGAPPAPAADTPIAAPAPTAGVDEGPGDLPAPPAPRAAGGGVNAALAKLKGLQGGGAAVPTPAAPEAAPAATADSSSGAGTHDAPGDLPPPSAPAAAAGAVNAALARLKGLKGLKGGGAAATAPTPEVADAPETPGTLVPDATASAPAGDDRPSEPGDLPHPPDPKAAGGGVQAALARLKGLGGTGGAAASPADASPADAPPTDASSTDAAGATDAPAADPATPGDAANVDDCAPLPPPPAPEKGKKLGGMAERLQALRDPEGTG